MAGTLKKSEIIEEVKKFSQKRGDRRPCILIVDDDSDLSSDLCLEFNSIGFESISAADGVKAERLLEDSEQGIDIVLSDYRMPQKSGTRLLQWVNSASESRPLFFLMSGYSQGFREQKGVAGFFEKPFDYHVLMSDVVSALLKHMPDSRD